MSKAVSPLKYALYALQWLLLSGGLLFFRLLPLDAASALGGKLARLIGPRLKWQRIAEVNLSRALPELTAPECRRITQEMWDNLGRSLAELPRLGNKTLAERLQYNDQMTRNFKQQNETRKPTLFLSAHLANWELIPWIGALHDTPITLIYRHLNNPFMERKLLRIRGRYCKQLFPKGKPGAKALIKTLSKGGKAGLLVDQKQNDGMRIPFFGHPAPTTLSPAELALKYKAEVYMVRCIRDGGCHFKFELKTFQPHPDSTPEELMTDVNAQLESWIREYPGQWLWLHQRWGKLSELE